VIATNNLCVKYGEQRFVDPDTTHIRAIRAYKKAGFKKIKMVKKGMIMWILRGKI
jgi:hypothetical protein